MARLRYAARVKVELWSAMIRHLPPDLTLDEVAAVFRREKSLVGRRLRAYGYQVSGRRVRKVPEWAKGLDWRLPNSDLARTAKVSRERIRQVRALVAAPRMETRGRKVGA